MTNAISTLARLDWQRMASFTIKNPRQAFVNAAIAYLVFRQAVKGVKKVSVYGLHRMLALLWRKVAGGLIYHVRRAPGAGAVVQRNIAKAIKDIEDSMNIDLPGETKYLAIPEHPMTDEEILAVLQRRQNEAGVDWKNGRASGAVYHGGEELARLTNEAYAMFSLANPLHPGVFPGMRRLEAEVVRMVLSLYNATSECCGTTTSGGTESIIMAVRAHVMWGRKARGIESPNIVVPITAHAAFDKAAEYFNIGITHIPVDPKTQKVDVKAMKRAIDSDTVLIVGSSVTYPHGVSDDLAALSDLAIKYKIGFHVDSCLGSFIVPFLKEAGFPEVVCDFRLPGVTSISCDTHKYGFAPKGTSVVMYANKQLRHYQYFTIATWPGGIYASPTIAGSRCGAVIASCWAAMAKMGREGYLEECRRIVSSRVKIQRAIEQIPELYVVGEPSSSVVAFSSRWPVNIYGVMDELKKRGWELNPMQDPPALHIACTRLTVPVTDELIRDLNESVAAVKANPDGYNNGSQAIYGFAATVPDTTIVDEVAQGFIDTLYAV
ncbi:Dihydrosphingosine phosphate lyase [Coemansia sp. RSA 989]|nr:Dihydrosphingosine phosphate lyase [Coemansia sp. RSA 1086]KAJ1752995.1 Dihydrosphingosine phosphate lyase [Coemansia sp. RSA 1821]KAJ1866667.1 Dihydrosphingosine phosphate lyase [Coemansia sp. RSA 989]KAJ1875510.1 Dihydrosphingosine phosphate lyase [Coemansia sp. RSA 990]KAJ2630309.1 Dihydrosphingosine phosphate lyase [Coemansia sp. RSA 1290]KAJ2651947.1 Dihydrosphingosine phosphate lyase [Coemansia sp. RSA 1250]KAJ2674974.1 Dihydrosphingosine phosphate lyase [Coemansia sp. RSA 1085]